VTQIRYRPEIDGLRALAVVPVVMFHLGVGFPGGFVGVDIFFVISGFLITGIIRRGLENETFLLAEFWERRIRRIFPALLVVVAATLAVGYWVLIPNELEGMAKSSVAQALMLANVYFWRDTNYFAGPAEFKPLLHMWSLAVEEQFYLFFPLALSFFRRLSGKKLFALLTVVAFISFSGSVYGSIFHTGATFFLLPTRAWELLIGCMLAVFPWQFKSAPRRDSAIATLGVLAIALPVFLYDSMTRFPGIAAAPPVLGTAAILFATANTSSIWVCKILSLRPFAFVGLISYSLYLWHWPVIVYTRIYFGNFGWKQMVFASVVSLLLAILSWRFVETPFRQSTFLRRRLLFATTFFMSATTCAISIFLVLTGGLPSRFPNYNPVLDEDTTWDAREHTLPLSEDFDFDKLPTLGEDLDNDVNRLDFVLWGDSHAATICDMVHEVALELNLSGKAVATMGLLGVPNICMPFNETLPAREVLLRQKAVMEMLAFRQPRNLMIVSRWSYYTDGHSAIESKSSEKRRSLLLDDDQGLSVTAPPEEVISRNLEKLVMFCETNHIKLWVVKQAPETGMLFPARELFLYSVGRAKQLSDVKYNKVDHQRRQEKIENIFQQEFFSDVGFIDPAPFLFNNKGEVMNFLDGRSLYRDNDHLTRWGVHLLRPLFKESMLEMKLQDGPRKVSNGEISS
jgi:peptidoglycan/LPS O-acetylase OafA/YrhL